MTHTYMPCSYMYITLENWVVKGLGAKYQQDISAVSKDSLPNRRKHCSAYLVLYK